MLNMASEIRKSDPVPVFRQIKDLMIEHMKKKNLRKGDLLPSESELCEIFNVSRMTARKAITALIEDNIVCRVHGKGTFVFRKVEQGYALKHKVIGIITPRYTGSLKLNMSQSPTHYRVIESIEQYCGEKEMELSIITSIFTKLSVADLKAMPVTGIILLFPHQEHSELIKKLKKCGIPFVAVHCFLDIAGINKINIDVFKSSYEATSLLIGKGRKDIVFLGQSPFSGAGHTHYQGYEKAMMDSGLVPKLYAAPGYPETAWNFDDFRRKTKKFDGIVAAEDPMAACFIKAAVRTGINVPDDVSVCGFYDSEICQHISPPLTSIREPLHMLGIAAVKRLYSLLEKPGSAPETTMLPTKLIVREST
jgi:GntR family transcriptional regulator of arabinose operon